MKHLKVRTIFAMALLGFAALSCKENKNEETQKADLTLAMNEMKSNNLKDKESNSINSNVSEVITLYLEAKNDLVAEDGKAAAEVSNKLVVALEKMDLSKYDAKQQTELKSIVNKAIENAKYIGNSEISKQREHFKLLSNNMIELVTITGSEGTLYEQYCPMYDKGSSWLSDSKEIRNPYYGSKMLACGRVEKEFN